MPRYLHLVILSIYALSAEASLRFVAPLAVRGGASDYASQLDALQAKVLEDLAPEIEALRIDIEVQGKVVPDLGVRAEMICNSALEKFATLAPSSDHAQVFDAKLQKLESQVDAPLHVLYLKQLAHLREQALQSYRAQNKNDYESMLQADASFCEAAQASTRDGADWDFGAERTFLQQIMAQLAEGTQKVQQNQLQASQQQQTAMQFLQSQQQMIQQLQMQLYGQSSPWNVGVAYRIPDTNFNLQGSYQQGRANVQLSCVPDEYAPFLGPNGFTNGVGPGNLGLSVNLSI